MLDPILEAFARAPIGEPLTPEQRAELDQMMVEIAAGQITLVPHEERELRPIPIGHRH